jgi:cobalt/nickel transport system permease protein
VILAAGFAVAVAAQSDPRLLVVATVASFALLAAARHPPGLLRRRVLAIEVLVVAVVATLPFTMPGDVVWAFGPLGVSDAGLARAAVVALRATAIGVAVLALLGGLDATRLGSALAQLRAPPGLVATLAFATRYLYVLERELVRLHEGMRARGFRPRADLRTWRTLGWFVGAMTVRAFERSERVLEAMRCRGFDGRFPSEPERRWPRREGVLLALAGGLLTVFATGGWA